MDTVVLRLHNLQKYFWVVNQVVALTSGYTVSMNQLEVNTPAKELLKKMKEYASEGVFITEGEIDEIINHKHNQINSIGQYLNLKTVIYHDSNRKLNLAYRRKHKAISSSYDLLTNVCYDRDYIEWNFSIPKFLYGNNIAQFVSHPGEHNFTKLANDYTSATRNYYERFIYFIHRFFAKNFVFDKTNWKFDFLDLELNRLDYSWNCFFRSESESKVYLDYIKKIKPKGVRENSDVRGGLYGGTYMIVRDGYSTKVYHKGTEFKTKDRRELLKNPDITTEYIDSLQELADRCLRFEITLRNQQLSYLYQTNIFRTNSKTTNAMREDAKQGRKYYEIKVNNPERFRELTSPTKKFNAFGHHIGFSDHQKEEVNRKIEAFKEIEALNTIRRTFVFGNDEKINFFNENYTPVYRSEKGEIRLGEKKVCLNKNIFNLWHNFFLDFVRETEVRHLPSFDSLQNKIVKHNQNVTNYRTTFTKEHLEKLGAEKKLNAKRILRHLALLQKYTVKEILDYGLVERTTLWRLQKDLKKFGIDLKYGMTGAEETIPIMPDYIFEWKEPDEFGLGGSRIIRHAGGFNIYNIYTLDKKLFCNPTYV